MLLRALCVSCYLEENPQHPYLAEGHASIDSFVILASYPIGGSESAAYHQPWPI
jgi:hypothetical protein